MSGILNFFLFIRLDCARKTTIVRNLAVDVMEICWSCIKPINLSCFFCHFIYLARGPRFIIPLEVSTFMEYVLAFYSLYIKNV